MSGAAGNTDDSIEPPELTPESIMQVADPQFTSENVAIVTGGASGIGRATALVLAANGLTTVATDVDEEGLAGTIEKAAELDVDGRVEPVVADLTSDEELPSIVETAADLGQIRYLANIAGLQHISPIEDFPMETYDLMHRVMLRAPLLLSQLTIPHLREIEEGTGAIGNMASVHGHYVTRDKVAYNSMKFGIRGLTNSIAAETDGSFRSFSVSTGYVKTPLVMNQIADTARERGISEREVVENVMLGQARLTEMMDPVEVGNLFAFGFSKHSRLLNGADLLWDGGYVETYE
ncbi:MAG: SDR family NAD(P)-dependent oxidoreductase [Halodesulfurarchaeum sp.]